MNFHPTNATQLWKLKLGDELPCHREELEGTVRGTVTLHYSRYLRLLSSSKVRSTTSAGAAHVCCGVTAVHDCAGREPTYCVPEPCFQEATLWITPPRGWTHLQMCEEYRPVSLPMRMASVVLINTSPILLYKFMTPSPPVPFSSLSTCLSPSPPLPLSLAFKRLRARVGS